MLLESWVTEAIHYNGASKLHRTCQYVPLIYYLAQQRSEKQSELDHLTDRFSVVAGRFHKRRQQDSIAGYKHGHPVQLPILKQPNSGRLATRMAAPRPVKVYYSRGDSCQKMYWNQTQQSDTKTRTFNSDVKFVLLHENQTRCLPTSENTEWSQVNRWLRLVVFR